MMNDPNQNLYKLYVEKKSDIDQIDQMNFRYGMDGSEAAPENPTIAKRNFTRKKNPDGTEIQVEEKNVVRFMHWNILADKLT